MYWLAGYGNSWPIFIDSTKCLNYCSISTTMTDRTKTLFKSSTHHACVPSSVDDGLYYIIVTGCIVPIMTHIHVRWNQFNTVIIRTNCTKDNCSTYTYIDIYSVCINTWLKCQLCLSYPTCILIVCF